MMKRLLNKKGSVLFLVVVVMSILIIAASATFYIVNNQHSSVNVRYSSEQSYQTAVSVSDTVSKYIDGYLEAIAKSGNDLSLYSDTLIGKMLSMKSGGTKDITSELNLSDIGMGNAKVTISKPQKTGGIYNPRPDGDNKIHTYEITTEAVVDGEIIKITQVKEIVSGPTEYFTRFLTSTDGRGEDVTFGSYMILSDAYFENEYTILGASAATRLTDAVYSSGSLYVRGLHYAKPKAGQKVEMVVSDNLLLEASGINFMSQGGDVYVGGNFEALDNGSGNTVTPIWANNVYVLGDFKSYGGELKAGSSLYVAGDCYLNYIDRGDKGSFNNLGKIYVNGDLYLNSFGNYFASNTSEFYVKGKVYLSGGIYNAINGVMQYGDIEEKNGSWSYNDAVEKVTNMPDPFSEEKINDVTAHIVSSTKKNEYKEWDAEGYFSKLEKEANDSGIPLPDIYPGKNLPNPWSPDGPPIPDDSDCIINENCILHPSEGWAGSWSMHNIIIDATVSDIYIKLQPEAGSKEFSFVKKNVTDPNNPYHSNLNILIKGSHSVIFVLPSDTDFVMPSGTFLGHIGFASKIAGMSDNDVIDNKPNLYIDYFYGSNRGDVNSDGIPISGAVKNVSTWFYKSLNVEKVPDGSFIIKQTDFSVSDTHNNIFIVTKGTKNQLDFSGTATYCGYIYAPKSILRANTTKGPSLSFIGGLIVGSYTYSDLNAALMFTMPCDYNDNYGLSKKTDIVKHLISFAKSGESGGDDVDPVLLQEYRTIGYK